MKHTIFQGNVYDVVPKLEDNSIDFLCTSPPYFSLRDYHIPPVIINGNPECKHEWIESNSNADLRYRGKNSYIGKDVDPEVLGSGEQVEGAICKHCNAFFGQLGHEFSPAFFVEHLVYLFSLIRPKLKDTATMFVNIGDSVTRNNSIVIKYNEHINRCNIGDFIDEYMSSNGFYIDDYGREISINVDVYILTVDNNYNCVWTKPSVFIRHKTDKRLYDINISNHHVFLTEDHSLINELLHPEKPNLHDSYIYIKKYPDVSINTSGCLYLDIKLLKSYSFIRFNGIEEFIKHNFEYILNSMDIYQHRRQSKNKYYSHITIYSWIRSKMLPISLFNEVSHLLKDNGWKDNAIFLSRKHTFFPMHSTLDKELIQFIGLWIADGSYSNNATTNISYGIDKCIVEYFRGYFDKYNIHITDNNKGDMCVNSVLFNDILHSLNTTGNSYTKRVPSFVYNLSKQNIAWFLSGYLSGDGSLDKTHGTISFSTVSKDLRDDISTLFKLVGYDILYTQQINNSGFKSGSMSYTGKLTVKDTYDFIGLYPLLVPRKNLRIKPQRRKQNLQEYISKIKIKKIVRVIDYNDYVYDISVPETERFVCNDILLHNTYSQSGGTGSPKRSTTHTQFGKTQEEGNYQKPHKAIGYPPKTRLCVPERFSTAMVDNGWILRNALVHFKSNSTPESVLSRFSRKYEMIYFFTKSPDYYFNLPAIKRTITSETIERYQRALKLGAYSINGKYSNGEMGRPTQPPSWVSELTIPTVHKQQTLFSEDLSLEKETDSKFKEVDNPETFGSPRAREDYDNSNVGMGNPWDVLCDVLFIPNKGIREKHYASFSTALVEYLITAGCPELVCSKCGVPKRQVYSSGGNSAFNIHVRDVKEGRIKYTDRVASDKEVEEYNEDEYVSDEREQVISEGCNCNKEYIPATVFDPFAGSFTTCGVAKEMGRSSIGIELSEDYINIAIKRFNFSKTFYDFEIIKD